MINFFLRYKLPFLLAIVLLPAFFLAYSFFQPSLKETFKQATFEQASQKMRDHIREKIEEKQQSTLILAVSLSAQLSDRFEDAMTLEGIQPFADNNLKPIARELANHTEYKNLWLQVVDVQGTILYRSWSDIKEPSVKFRPEFRELRKNPRSLVCVSTDCCDVSIKALAPIYFHKKLVGFMEVISHFNSIQLDLQKKDVKSFVVATRERSTLVSQPFSSHRLYGHYVANLNPDSALLADIQKGDLEYWLKQPYLPVIWKDYLVIRYPLVSVNQQAHGYFLAFQPLDSIKTVDQLDRLTQQIEQLDRLFIILFLGVVFLIVLSVVLKHKRYYQAIMDEENEIVIVSDGVSIKQANKAFFRYFNEFDDLNGFYDRYHCICDLFVEEEGFLHKQMDGLNWFDYLLYYSKQTHKVKLRYQGRERIFDIKASRMPSEKGFGVVVLNDITKSENLKQKLLQYSMKDDLTGISNRRHFNESFKKQINAAQRYHSPLTLIIFDIDFFKRVNDNYGHDVGDKVLKKLAQAVQNHLRESDEFYRIGGEEFAVIVTHQTLEQTRVLAEKLRREIEETDFAPVEKLTVSLGVAEYEGQTLQEFFKLADNALYDAKHSGRNCVKIGKPEPETN